MNSKNKKFKIIKPHVYYYPCTIYQSKLMKDLHIKSFGYSCTLVYYLYLQPSNFLKKLFNFINAIM